MKLLSSPGIDRILRSKPVHISTIQTALANSLDLLITEDFSQALWGCVLVVEYLSLHVEDLGLLDIPDDIVRMTSSSRNRNGAGLARRESSLSTNSAGDDLNDDKPSMTWPWEDRLAFWKSLNDNILFCIQCSDPGSISIAPPRSAEPHPYHDDEPVFFDPEDSQKTPTVTAQEWLQIRDALLKFGDRLFRFGSIDYDLGLRETAIMDAIHSRLLALSSPHPPSHSHSHHSL